MWIKMFVGIIVAYIIFLGVLFITYRLNVVETANFPGPKFAALTGWYEAFYETVVGRPYSLKIDQLHHQYGPVVRVAPNELHIRDSEFYDTVFASNSETNKPVRNQWTFNFSKSTAATVGAAVHRRRRAALEPMFSRSSVLKAEHLIRYKARLLCQRVAEFKGSPQPIIANHAFSAFAGDVLMEYVFGFSYKQLEKPNFDSVYYHLASSGSFERMATFSSAVVKLITCLPEALIEVIHPATASLHRFKRDVKTLARGIIHNRDISSKSSPSSEGVTVFHEILKSNLPAADKSQRRLAEEAQMMVVAGVAPTASALTVGTFHIANSTQHYQRLHKELVHAFPDDKSPAQDLESLEKLPFLNACVQETLRLSSSRRTARDTRVHPKTSIKYKDEMIAPGTEVSMNISDVLLDGKIFPQPREFQPERWLGNPRAPDGQPHSHYLLAFGRGSRNCLGQHLARAELFYGLGMIFRHFQLELYETDEKALNNSSATGNQGVRIRVVRASAL